MAARVTTMVSKSYNMSKTTSKQQQADTAFAEVPLLSQDVRLFTLLSHAQGSSTTEWCSSSAGGNGWRKKMEFDPNRSYDSQVENKEEVVKGKEETRPQAPMLRPWESGLQLKRQHEESYFYRSKQ